MRLRSTFSLCASSAYLLNDLMDLPSDRHHPRKRQRALASGRLPLAHGLALSPLLLGAGLVSFLGMEVLTRWYRRRPT